MADRVLREREVRQLTGLSRTTRFEQIRAGRFPAPIKLTDRNIGWLESELTEWLAKRPRVAA